MSGGLLRLRRRRQGATPLVLPTIRAACRHLETRVEALRALGTPLNTMVAALEIQDPRAIRVVLTTRAEALAAAVKKQPTPGAEPLLRWLSREDPADTLRVIVTDGSQGITEHLSSFVARVERAHRENQEWRIDLH